MQKVVGTVLKDSVLFLIQIWNYKLFLSFLEEDYTYVEINVNILLKLVSVISKNLKFKPHIVSSSLVNLQVLNALISKIRIQSHHLYELF